MRSKKRHGGSRTRPLQTPARRSPRLFVRTARALPVLLNQENGSGKSPSTHIIFVSDSEFDDGNDNGGVSPDSIHRGAENDGRLSPQMGNSDNEDLMVGDSLEKGATCIRCKGSDEQVLVCSEIGCLIAVHEKCMGCDPTFDDSGKFYCPHCKHLRALAVTREMRRRVMAARKALLDFLEDEGNECDTLLNVRDGIRCDNENVENGLEEQNQFLGEKEMNDAQEGGHDQDKVVLENVAQPNTCVANGGDNVGGGGEGTETGIDSLQGSITKEILDKDGEDEQEEDSEPMDDGEDLGIAEGNEEREVSNTSHVAGERIVDDAVDGSTRGADTRVSKENEGIEEDEEQRQPESSDGLANADDISENEFVVKCHRRFKRRAGKTIRPQNVSSFKRSSPRLRQAVGRQKTTAKKNALVFDEETTISKKSQESSKQIPIMDFPNAKRKRLHWKLEEEEMLRIIFHVNCFSYNS
ncbi:Autoimmune regulator [Trema orientale]|uniref:Autoimmune regulator n=1 Tax=Trema orientale TaxID=63057 RepID=A0A2P5ER40_TREOI|nr:Autoimmune regulator [Trema orientale]